MFAIIIAPLTVRQFFSPPNAWINLYSTEGEGIATSGISERVRATGTFSYISGLGEFASLAVWAGLVAFSISKNARGRLFGYAGLIAGLVCTFVTVSRAVAVISLAIIAVWAVFGGQLGRKMQSAFVICIVALSAAMASGYWEQASEIGATVYIRHESQDTDTFAYRLWYQFVMPMDALVVAPMGNGIGTEQAGRAASAESVRAGSTYESPWGRTIMELGIAGLLGFLVTLGIAFAPWRAALKALPSGGGRSALVATGAALFTRAALGFQFNHVAAYFFWAMTACVIAIGNSPPPTLASMNRTAASNSAARPAPLT